MGFQLSIALFDRSQERGNKAFESQDYKTALDLYTKAIEVDEKNHTLYSNRSATFAAIKEWQKALTDAEKTIALNDKWPKVRALCAAANHATQR